jgi:hypothetical protein
VWSGIVGPQASIDLRSWAPGTYVLQIAGERLRVVVAR